MKRGAETVLCVKGRAGSCGERVPLFKMYFARSSGFAPMRSRSAVKPGGHGA